jgi:hypothetical protein
MPLIQARINSKETHLPTNLAEQRRLKSIWTFVCSHFYSSKTSYCQRKTVCKFGKRFGNGRLASIFKTNSVASIGCRRDSKCSAEISIKCARVTITYNTRNVFHTTIFQQ